MSVVGRVLIDSLPLRGFGTVQEEIFADTVATEVANALTASSGVNQTVQVNVSTVVPAGDGISISFQVCRVNVCVCGTLHANPRIFQPSAIFLYLIALTFYRFNTKISDPEQVPLPCTLKSHFAILGSVLFNINILFCTSFT